MPANPPSSFSESLCDDIREIGAGLNAAICDWHTFFFLHMAMVIPTAMLVHMAMLTNLGRDCQAPDTGVHKLQPVKSVVLSGYFLLGVQEVPGSDPLGPTKFKPTL
jgi:hypothetical protein